MLTTCQSMHHFSSAIFRFHHHFLSLFFLFLFNHFDNLLVDVIIFLIILFTMVLKHRQWISLLAYCYFWCQRKMHFGRFWKLLLSILFLPSPQIGTHMISSEFWMTCYLILEHLLDMASSLSLSLFLFVAHGSKLFFSIIDFRNSKYLLLLVISRYDFLILNPLIQY